MAKRLTPAQEAARKSILVDAMRLEADERDKGVSWDALHSRGHHYMQVMACVWRGDLDTRGHSYWFWLTPAGRSAVAPPNEGGGE